MLFKTEEQKYMFFLKGRRTEEHSFLKDKRTEEYGFIERQENI